MERRHVICRACHAQCGLLAEMEDGRPVKLYGDKDNAAYHGYSCIKGRRLGAYHASTSRLLQSQKRVANGEFAPIANDGAMREIAKRVRTLIDRHGPRAVAGYIGTHGYNNLPTQAFAYAFFEAIGSPMLFTSVTIDQPGKGIATALHGAWLAGTPRMESWEVLLLIGTNPLVSMNGGLGVNPARRLHDAKRRGMKLIVVDPRRTECAAQANIHLQGRPGEDGAILAGIAHVLIAEELVDTAFVANETTGFAALAEAVRPFTPRHVAERAGIDAEDLVEAARLLGQARSGAISAGTGANMSGHGNLAEYLVRALTSIRGFWMRPGETIPNPGVLINRFPPIAATPGPQPAFGFGEPMRVRGLANTVSGLPTAALADEILLPGEGQVKALFVFGGNPMLAWPDQLKTFAAMKELDLLVCFDPQMSETARLAHYVIAPKLPFECSSTTMLNEMLGNFGPGWGYSLPYAQYSPPLLDPPPDADVIEEWEGLYRIAQEIGTQLHIKDFSLLDPAEAKAKGTHLDMQARLNADDVWQMLTRNAPLPFAEIKAKATGGHVFERPTMTVAARPQGWQGRLDIGNPQMLAELSALAASGTERDKTRPYQVISRRLHDVLNSSWHDDPVLRRRVPVNAAFMNPDDMAHENLDDGDVVELESARAAIRAIVKAEAGVRRGCISMAHA
ncbi:MAG: molybdopterin-dependent oxidoreductase, partial [Alphaproteobacteria bacterium]|nr:molybdopterin-dependent oxidoreductase [Alphaproteobacteria bacterium]